MKKTGVTLQDVQDVYNGPEGVLWELIMGEQIHVGGFKSSAVLAEKAGIRPGMKGLDLCSALGAGCRFLVRFHEVTMCGLDATDTMIAKAKERTEAEDIAGKIEYRKGDVTQIPYDNDEFDFVWGEDAWCYVDDKEKLINNAARVLKPGGILAFTDWIEGAEGLSDDDAYRINAFMKFPYMESAEGYKKLMEQSGLTIIESTDLTEEFAGYIDLYIKMLTDQLTFDALRIIDNNLGMFQAMGSEMKFMSQKAHEGSFGRGRFIARK